MEKNKLNTEYYWKIKDFLDTLLCINLKFDLYSINHENDAEISSNNILDEDIKYFSIDSQDIVNNSIFFGGVGLKFNGGMFADQAYKNGAIGALSNYIPENLTKKCEKINTENLPNKISGKLLIIVEDVFNTLTLLAIYRRQNFNGNVIAVTGSVAKTTTKEMIAIGLENFLKENNLIKHNQNIVHKTPGNKNSTIGLSQTIVNTPKYAEYIILEMGSLMLGNIKELCDIAKPNITLIIEINYSHIEKFKEISTTIKEKCSIVDHLGKDGICIYNGKSEYAKEIFAEISKKNINIIQYSDKKNNEIYLIDSKDEISIKNRMIEKKSYVRANIFGYNVQYTLNEVGDHIVHNSLAVLSVIYHLFLRNQNINNFKFDNIFRTFCSLNRRGSTVVIDYIASKKNISNLLKINKIEDYTENENDNYSLILDESYNASFQSICASIERAIKYKLQLKTDLICVISDLRELGNYSESIQQTIIDTVVNYDINTIIFYGTEFYKLINRNDNYKKLEDESYIIQGKNVYVCLNKEGLLLKLYSLIKPKSITMYKGANGMKIYEDIITQFIPLNQ